MDGAQVSCMVFTTGAGSRKERSLSSSGARPSAAALRGKDGRATLRPGAGGPRACHPGGVGLLKTRAEDRVEEEERGEGVKECLGQGMHKGTSP